MRVCDLVFVMLALVSATISEAQQVEGSMTVNGKTGKATHVSALEVDSDTEPGFLDVLVVLSDRALKTRQMRDVEELERLMQDEGLIALRLLLDPDCKVKSVAYYHPAFSHFLVNVGEDLWEPSAFDDTVAGRVRSDGRQEAFGQLWRYDFTFSAPIVLDPEAVTVP